MRRLQLNTTLPKEDLDFIRENAMTMTLEEMGRRLKCSAGKVGNNARIAGIELPHRNQSGNCHKAKVVDGEFFNVNQYSDWVTGFGRYMSSEQ